MALMASNHLCPSLIQVVVLQIGIIAITAALDGQGPATSQMGDANVEIQKCQQYVLAYDKDGSADSAQHGLGSFASLIERYGAKVFRSQYLLSAKGHSKEECEILLGNLMFMTSRSDPEGKDLALVGLDSQNAKFKQKAVGWCVVNLEILPDDVRIRIAKLRRQLFIESKGRDCYLLEQPLLSEDAPSVREIYEKYWQNASETTSDGQPITQYNCSARSVRRDLIELLCRLGDAKALESVEECIRQETDVQQRVWGIFLACKSQHMRSLHLLKDCLGDDRACTEYIARIPANDNSTWYEYQTRVCDVATRAIYELYGPPNGVKTFQPASLWYPLQFDAKNYAFKRESREERHQLGGIVDVYFVVGFNEAQLQQARDRVKAIEHQRKK